MRYLEHSPKVVALVGMGPSITDLFNETLTQECSPNFVDEIWTINMVGNIVRADLIIWMDDFTQQQNFKPGLFELLRKYKTPVLTSVAYPEIVPLSYDYPIDEVSQFSIPVFGKPYLTNGVAMGIAYAMWKKVKILKIYGCDFTYPNRNFAEEGRACTEAWITLASMSGMEIQLAPNTSLLDRALDKGIYGYKEQPEVTGPNGMKFKYIPRPVDGKSEYTATDSSGGQDDTVSGLAPRAPGHAAAIQRPNGHANGSAQAQIGTAPGSSPRVSDSNRHGRAEEQNSAGDDSGGREGHIPR